MGCFCSLEINPEGSGPIEEENQTEYVKVEAKATVPSSSQEAHQHHDHHHDHHHDNTKNYHASPEPLESPHPQPSTEPEHQPTIAIVQKDEHHHHHHEHDDEEKSPDIRYEEEVIPPEDPKEAEIPQKPPQPSISYEEEKLPEEPPQPSISFEEPLPEESPQPQEPVVTYEETIPEESPQPSFEIEEASAGNIEISTEEMTLDTPEARSPATAHKTPRQPDAGEISIDVQDGVPFEPQEVNFEVIAEEEEKSPNKNPIYRYYNQDTSDHFYTHQDKEMGTTETGKEASHGYVCEGTAFKLLETEFDGYTAVYRYWNSEVADHLYTTNPDEIGTIVEGETGKYGYICEGRIGYISKNPSSDTVPLYRYWNHKTTDHFYTTNADEIGKTGEGELGNYEYTCEGTLGYVYK